MKYEVISSHSKNELEAAVNALIKEGWIPQGGVAIQPGSSDLHPAWVQAMIHTDAK